VACKAIYAGSIPAAASITQFNKVQEARIKQGIAGFLLSKDVQWYVLTSALNGVLFRGTLIFQK
jgi:hypothetical protein